MDDARASTLPTDVEALKAFCTLLLARVAEKDATLADRETRIAWLEAQLLKMRKRLYGPRADRLSTVAEIGQLLLEFATRLEARPTPQADPSAPDAPDATVPASEARRIGAKRKGAHGRRRLADLEHLPVRTVEHDLPESEKSCPCCGKERTRIGCEESWQVEFIPGHFERWCHRRHTYACRDCDREGLGGQVETAPLTSAPAVDKGMAGPGLLAYVVTSKFADYLPLYRLENIFGRNGLALSRSTLSTWCRDVAEIAMPLYRRMAERVRSSKVVGTDDTVMPLLEKEKTRQARMWVYLGDESHPYTVFDFTPSRARDGPTRFLEDFRGTLVADAYGGYDGIVAGNGITRAGCWAHARRKFVDLEKTEPKVAREAVTLVDALFAVERSIRDAIPEARASARRDRSGPIVETIKSRLHHWKGELLPKHPMAGAVRYALNQWSELTVFLNDPEVPIDNNACEREMKRQALNRKNSLFVGSLRGGETAAILSSLTSSCRRHEVDPQIYLTQLLVNLPGTPADELDRWLPDEWKRRHTESD
jgi:transposase